MKFRHSLLARYLSIITAALILWPFVIPIYYIPSIFLNEDIKIRASYIDTNKLEQMWHSEALKLNGANKEKIEKKLHTLAKEHPEAVVFWVDSTGKTELSIGKQSIPEQWTEAKTIQFMKNSVGSGPYTIIEYIGDDPRQGFMVFQIPSSLTKPLSANFIDDKYFMIYGIAVFALFLGISWLFFSKIRKRLVKLQNAMTTTGDNGIPEKVMVRKLDEIGQLGKAFNHMIDDLMNGRKREQEEEALRKQLIANISHDLRTPLTTIRGHAHSLQKENLSPNGKESLQLIENKVDLLSLLLDNLLSYTLLSAGKYPINKSRTDVHRILRTSVASWYPIFEKEGFEVNIHLLEKAVHWDIDPHWFTRIMDNIFQNVIRHAKSGKYVGIYSEEKEGKFMISIKDKGPGMDKNSSEKGVGIGLSIIELMLQEMNLTWDIISTAEGTTIYLYEKLF
ncbi:histidine kinase dimerization/phospho-acceptor domain-containing protein [Lederbergia wuyishanensis]|uniref:histidine kinase n=1 Tax=Lederbergia wuyishanensis TaxID=1347903 RepID=A0ABU0D3W2_9BACI|nr:HAMP domain-containing sensor histidine kinase [Lederbergia wuyishanensis]MCJ8007756.1 HAMP domain-containing histidine kinase [Lederbergia wuyishanensis]MDQ0343081.1 signal transduction histidine kinase [Lederbergia wuyishanensis]